MKHKNPRSRRSFLFEAAQLSYHLYQQFSQPKDTSGGFGQIPESVIQAKETLFLCDITPIQNRSRLAKHILRVRSGHFSDQTLVCADAGFCSQDDFTRKRNIEIEK